MTKRLTIGFIREQFEKEGYTLLSEKYIGSKTPLEYVCPKGHIGKIRWNTWQQGARCLECAGIKKLTIEFVRKQFEKEGYTLLSNEYINNEQKLEYVCPKGHRQRIAWCVWKRGCRCAECFGTKKYTLGFIRNVFEKEGYTLLSDKYIDSKTPLEYICQKKHKGKISWNKWRQGQRCAKCAGKKKYTIEEVKSSFEKERYTLLTKKYVDGSHKLDYICPKGHTGTVVWNNWQRGARCAKCYYENNKGVSNSNYNPNLTDEEREKKRSLIPENNEWAKGVKERDVFICQVCGDDRGGNLVSHHLEAYSSSPDLRTVLDNGVCLCEKCHKNFHYKYGYGNNTKEQFNEFVKTYNKEI